MQVCAIRVTDEDRREAHAEGIPGMRAMLLDEEVNLRLAGSCSNF